MMPSTYVILLVVVPSVLGNCPEPLHPGCRDRNWHIGVDRVRPSGTVVHGHANVPVSNGAQANVHGSRVFGGPHNGAQTVGGGLNYQHNGLHGGVDATHSRRVGTSYSANVGGSTKLGPGTLTVGGSAVQHPGSSRIHGQVGATYSAPLP